MSSSNALINEQEERSRVVDKFKHSITHRPFLCIALLLYWTWVNLAFQGPAFFPTAEISSQLVIPTWLAPVAISAVGYFVLGKWFRPFMRVVEKRWYLAVVAALMGIGALLCFIWINAFGASLASAGPLTLYLLGSLAIGAGTVCFLIEWGRIFGYLGPQEVLFQGIVAMLGSALFICVLSFFPMVVTQSIYVILPIPLAICFYRAVKNFPRKAIFEHGLKAELKVPKKFLFTAFLHGLALGVLVGSSLLDSNTNGVLLHALSFVVSALLLLLSAVFVKMDFNHLIYQVGFGIMALGALLIACLGDMPTIGQSVQLVGFCYVHLIMWGLCSYLTKNFSLPATWVVAWPTCCLMLGQFLGGITGTFTAQAAQADYWIQILFTVIVFVLLMSALLMLSNRNLTTGWGIARPANVVNSDSTIESVIKFLSVEKSLTPREAETLALMARGRNRKAISKELTLSEETIKSHSRSIYRKLSVHSQQELLDLIEERSESSQETNGSVLLED